jgi:alkanesulfonate monooxygenase SsuD/methylene tetrahydromethanopterin reductase-like flavin-dependent oxidoreductase (luciferase family)
MAFLAARLGVEMFSLRFDMRAPSHGAPASELYPAALDMVEWAEVRGLAIVVLSEHRAAPDGFLPSPITMAAALAARTTSVPISIAALLLPLYNPIRLAEDMAVLDLISGGRVSYTMGVGYRPEEFASLGVDYASRGQLAEEYLGLLLKALDGEVFECEGRTVLARPAPGRRIRISYGGKTATAARRAARFGLPFNAQHDEPGIAEAYRQECRRLGREPGRIILPAVGSPTTVFVADDVDEAWAQLGPYLLHDAVTYAGWHNYANTISLSRSTTIEDLRAEKGAHRIFSVDEAIEEVKRVGFLSLHPLCGGLPPDIAWPYLHRVVDEVLPAAAVDRSSVRN